MSRAAIVQHIEDYLAAIDLCLSNQLIVPSLVIIYSGIDFFAWIGLPPSKTAVKPKHFIAWAEKFMECQQRLGVSGSDLYAARCGIVHTHTADFDRGRNADAIRIFYTFGNREPESANAFNKKIGISERLIRVDDVIASLRHGLIKFGEKIEGDKEFEKSVLSRGGKLFCNFSNYPGLPEDAAPTQK